MRATVGFIGVGRMGLPMCANLVRAGYDVVAGDRRREREADVLSLGARWGEATEAIAAVADVLITMLPGSEEVCEAMAVALPALRAGTTWIDMSSCSPIVARELRASATACAVECIDSPVGGGPPAAAAGTLQLFVGGHAEAIEGQRMLLESLGRIDHVGGHGAGYTTKLLINLLWFGQAVACGEALLLARRAGLELETLHGVLGRSSAASEFIRRDLDALLDGDYLESFGLDRCCEELSAVLALARELDVPFDLSAQVYRSYSDALKRFGPRDGELLAVALLEQRAGVSLRRG